MSSLSAAAILNTFCSKTHNELVIQYHFHLRRKFSDLRIGNKLSTDERESMIRVQSPCKVICCYRCFVFSCDASVSSTGLDLGRSQSRNTSESRRHAHLLGCVLGILKNSLSMSPESGNQHRKDRSLSAAVGQVLRQNPIHLNKEKDIKGEILLKQRKITSPGRSPEELLQQCHTAGTTTTITTIFLGARSYEVVYFYPTQITLQS
ncbi:uncharacterized protein LOC134355284 isoform X2 [Mobula hypostoma]|uniref:uncharacterized protein LOC134355284 isoform X2 n=1 Tax=Mobula hypostoma TaxID=723540 RepID=UPI002FC3A3EA